jgi:hypothetical protein
MPRHVQPLRRLRQNAAPYCQIVLTTWAWHLLSVACTSPIMSSSTGSPAPPSGKSGSIDPVLRNALRYTISPREYQLLHQYLLSRAPAIRKRTLPPKKYDVIAKGSDDYNAAAIRASLRLAVVTFSGLKAWDVISTRFLNRGTSRR